ncbi:MAG: T9SS type A sorting domain-containing protein, partial [Crocinitomicaceae bacterium]|nr:T9SS type A sorting domain-containing protein [Crocinitomicaceae bacterium]
YGAHAFADYCSNNDLPVRAVLNNDVIGGVVCGETSSPPSCPGLNDVDSTQVRLFSIGSFNSAHKQLARFIKLEYQEELLPLVSVPMTLTIMSAEDRSGRGGDHIPFRQKFYPAMRFTSANEHGASSKGPGYSDRQHTSDDILGVDTNNDQIVDSFFVDFNYLARNACINGIAATVAAQGVPTPSYTVTGIEDSIVRFNVNIDSLPGYSTYRVAIRTTSNDWDTVYTLNGTSVEVIPPVANTSYYVSVATVNADGLESLFSSEKMLNQVTLDVTELEEVKGIELMQNHPNPFDEATYINIRVGESMVNQLAIIRIYDTQGKVVETMQTRLELGMNEMLYTHGYGRVGVYLYSLEVNGQLIDTKRMIFAN